MGFGGGGGDSGAAMAEEAARQKRIKEGMAAIETNFAGFDPAFYDSREKAYENWALPQVNEQYDKAREELAYALARQFGTLDTSVYADRTADLGAKWAKAKADVA